MEPEPAPASITTSVQPKLAVIQEARFAQNTPGENLFPPNIDAAYCMLLY